MKDVKKQLIIAGLVGALAIPTAAVAAGHRSATKNKAKGSAPRSGLTINVKPSKNVRASAKTKASARPKARTRSGRKNKATASPGRAKATVRTKRNKTAGTSGVSLTFSNGGSSAVSGNQGVGDVAPTLPISGTSV